MGTRDELLEAVGARYRAATRTEKGRILTEFAEISGYHRKHAERLLRSWTGRGPDRNAAFMATRCARRWSCSGKRVTGSAESG